MKPESELRIVARDPRSRAHTTVPWSPAPGYPPAPRRTCGTTSQLRQPREPIVPADRASDLRSERPRPGRRIALRRPIRRPANARPHDEQQHDRSTHHHQRMTADPGASFLASGPDATGNATEMRALDRATIDDVGPRRSPDGDRWSRRRRRRARCSRIHRVSSRGGPGNNGGDGKGGMRRRRAAATWPHTPRRHAVASRATRSPAWDPRAPARSG